ncbi:hypothetical protein ABW20_dc0102496 [Dactylellina cionopaga]|nr:hypothetical protein ABW20_dc0102496 [Dactylellina cionopaga]
MDAVQKLPTSLQKPPKRQSFGNHAWGYIRNSSIDPQNISPLDACAGPTTDSNDSVSFYLTNAVDSKATTDDKADYPNFNNNQQPVQYNGVTKILVDQRSGTGRNTPSWALLEQVRGDVELIPVSVESLFTSTLDKACGLLQAPAPSTGTDFHIGDTATFPYGPFTVRSGDPAVSSDCTLIRYDLWKTGGSGRPYLSISVVVLTDFAQAMSWLVTYPQPGITFGATLQSNVLMLLEGTADPTAMSAILSSGNDFMAPFFNKPLTEVDVDKCQLSGIPSNSSGNLIFQLILDAPGAIDVSVASNTKGIHVETTAVERGVSNSWKVDCVMFAGDCITEGRVFEVSFATEDTWFTTHKAFPIGP